MIRETADLQMVNYAVSAHVLLANPVTLLIDSFQHLFLGAFHTLQTGITSGLDYMAVWHGMDTLEQL